MSDRPPAAPAPFAKLSTELLSAYYEAHPVSARLIGLHAYDGRLPDASSGALERRTSELGDAIQRLENIDPRELSESEALEHRVLLSESRYERFRLREWRIWARYPLAYLELADVTSYMMRRYAPARDRAMALCLHLEGLPRLLDEAKENLDSTLDLTIVESAIPLFRSYVSFLEEDLAETLVGVDEGDARLRRSLIQARQHAAAAAHDFVTFLEERRRRAQPDSFAIGNDLFRKLLLYGEGVEAEPDRLLELAEGELAKSRAALEETAARIDPSLSPAEVMARIKRDHPAGADVLETTRRITEELRRFVAEKDLVTIPAETTCRVEPTPPFLSWAFALLDPPGMFEESDEPGFYFVTPPREDWDEADRSAWLTEFSFAGIRNMTIHEAWPGHFLQALHNRRNPSRVLRTFGSYSSVEAWAHYCEEMMLEAGYGNGDPALRMVQLGDALVRSVRCVAGIRMHTCGMTLEEAHRLFREEALLADHPARAEAERGTFDPGIVNYTLGKLMLRKLRSDWEAERGDGFSLKEFHDSFLSWGSAPLPFVRPMMLRAPGGDVFPRL
jgi:uncharacterized protein (DUF885 family)